jgi:hypothetical protein
VNATPEAVYELLLNHGMPLRNAAYTGNGFAASTRNTGSPLDVVHPSTAHSEGTMANALTRSAHIADRHIPLRDREHDR